MCVSFVSDIVCCLFFFFKEHSFRYVTADLDPVFSNQNELVIDIIECTFQFNARRIFHKVLCKFDNEKIL